jgi:hypothetical protein
MRTIIYRGVVGAVLLVSAMQARAELKGWTFQGSCLKSTISLSDGVQTGIVGGLVSPQLYGSVMKRARASHLELGSDGFLWANQPLACKSVTVFQKDDDWYVAFVDGDITTPVAIFEGKLIGSDGPILFMDGMKLGNADAIHFNSHNNVPTCHFTFANGGGGFTPGWKDRLEVIDCEGRAKTTDGHLITVNATFARARAPSE